MRRFISILTVALVAIFTTTSCQLNEGTERNPNRANQLLWSRVSEAIYDTHNHALVVAYLNDTMLGRTYADDVYKPHYAEETNGTYTIRWGNESYQTAYYRIKTDGKRLDEAGVWTLQIRYGTYSEFANLGKAIGVAGEVTKFQLSTDNEDIGYYRHCNTTECDVEYEYDDIDGCLVVRYNTFKGSSTDNYEAQHDYIIAFEATEPIVIHKEIESGEVEIQYQDLVKGTSRGVSVGIYNKIATFAP